MIPKILHGRQSLYTERVFQIAEALQVPTVLSFYIICPCDKGSPAADKHVKKYERRERLQRNVGQLDPRDTVDGLTFFEGGKEAHVVDDRRGVGFVQYVGAFLIGEDAFRHALFVHLREERPAKIARRELLPQIGGQIAAGFVITGFYEDYDREVENNPLSRFMPTYIATRAVKL